MGGDEDPAKAAAISSEGSQEGMAFQNLDVIILDDKGYKKNRKGPVTFTHKEHAKEYRVFCWQCHHVYKDGKNVWVGWGKTKKCRQCHHPQKKDPTGIMLQKAYHLGCKGCHKKLFEEKKETGAFKKCGGCHAKKVKP